MISESVLTRGTESSFSAIMSASLGPEKSWMTVSTMSSSSSGLASVARMSQSPAVRSTEKKSRSPGD